ncbi:MAG: glycoside hydrolase family 99-like domain-containing protein [Gemmobacter sp.]|jgi:hypothetical protein
MFPVRPIAFYLPQFHPVPENDAWWGKGFTEWRNVVRARPLFPGHRQPRLPADLGFYDLRVPEIRLEQARLARAAGLEGFCYYHYWFSGRKILERPIEEMAADPRCDLPFCLFWANERWTRTWNGKGDEVLIEQSYSAADAEALADYLIPFFTDPRYIRVDGRPVYVVYHPIQNPIWPAYAATLRRRAEAAGFPGLYLCMVRKTRRQADPREFGCDAAVEFPPSMGPDAGRNRKRALEEWGGQMPAEFGGELMHYDHFARRFPQIDYGAMVVHRTVQVDYDDTARRGLKARLYPDASPEAYARWLRASGTRTLREHAGEGRLMFIFAWNEWAEGAYLEPDLDRGARLIEVTRAVLDELAALPDVAPDQ